MIEQMVTSTYGTYHPVQRVPTKLPINSVITFGISSPIGTHWRPATCEEFQCPGFLKGFRSIVPLDSSQAYYIEHDSGRKFVKLIIGPNQVQYDFEPGQRCFVSDTHRVPLERPSIFRMRDGDWRGNPSGRVVTMQPQPWADAFGENMEQVKEMHNHG